MDGNRRERPPRANTGNPSFYPPAHVAIQGFHHHHHLPNFCLTICISYFPDSEKQNIQLSESRRNSIRLSCGFGRALWGAPLTSHNHTDSLLTWEMEDTKHRGVFRCHFFGCAVFIELRLFGHEGGVSGFVVLELGVPKLFASVHVESPCSSTKSITLWSVPSSVAGLRVRRVICGTYFWIGVFYWQRFHLNEKLHPFLLPIFHYVYNDACSWNTRDV